MVMNESMMIVMKLPDVCLSPNRPCGSRGGRIKRAGVVKKQRRIAQELSQAEGLDSVPWRIVTAQAVFYHATDRRRDGANFNAMLKGAFDGIVDAGIVEDDDHKHWTTLPPLFKTDKKNPRVEIIITRVE